MSSLSYWLLGITVLAAVSGLLLARSRRLNEARKPIFHDLLDRFPSIGKSDALSEAEHDAFSQVQHYLVETTRVEVASRSRIAQLKKIRSDLRFIEREFIGKKFSAVPSLREIWELTLQKAAAQISEDYKLDQVAEQMQSLTQQASILASSQAHHVDSDNS